MRPRHTRLGVTLAVCLAAFVTATCAPPEPKTPAVEESRAVGGAAAAQAPVPPKRPSNAAPQPSPKTSPAKDEEFAARASEKELAHAATPADLARRDDKPTAPPQGNIKPADGVPEVAGAAGLKTAEQPVVDPAGYQGLGGDLANTTPKLVAKLDPAEPPGNGIADERDVPDTGKPTEKKQALDDREAPDANVTRAHGEITKPAPNEGDTFLPPATHLPRMFYFEPTYLGGSAAYAERLRRLDAAFGSGQHPYRHAFAEAQPFDPPPSAGLGVTATVDATHIDKPRRVFLQVGLQGSSRHGWRRPPLDAVLVIDAATLARGRAFIADFAIDLVRRLGSADRLGVVIAGEQPERFLEIARLETAQQQLAYRIEALEPRAAGDLGAALETAGAMLHAASDVEYIVPGTQTIFVLTQGNDAARIASAANAAHQLTLQGAVTSVFALDADESAWWQVANAGHGNLHRVRQNDFSAAIDYELTSIARVVARLVRINIRLGKDASAIRVLGTRVLDQDEVDALKAREVATDLNISKTLGVTSDRGGDDDGIQTVIPYFYGDDSHVILIELWVEKPGVVADVTVRYKDMVNLENATARASVQLGSRPEPGTPEQLNIARNVRGFELAESLQVASEKVQQNDVQGALDHLAKAGAMAAETNSDDASAVVELRAMIENTAWQASPAARSQMAETLLISGQRRVGDTKK